MGPESDHDALIPTPSGFADKPVEDKTVPEMDTVEESGRYNHFTSSKSCL
jgi:hypothetical protein